MIQFACPECATKRKYSHDLAGKRIVCRTCGKKSVLPRFSDDDDDPTVRRRKTTKTFRRKLGPKVEFFVWLCAGWLVSAVGVSAIMFSLVRRPKITQALVIAFPIGWVIIAVYFMLWSVAVRGACGAGVRLTRERKLVGKAGVQTGMAVVLGMAVLTIGGFELSGIPPERMDKHEVNLNQPHPGATDINLIPNPADATDERRRWKEAGSDFSMIPPPGWNAKSGPEKDKRTFLGPLVNGHQTHIVFVVDRNTTPPEEFVDVVMEGQRTVHPTLRILSRSAVETTSALRGTKVVAETTIDGRLFRVTQYFFGQEDQRLTITLTIPAAEGLETDAVFEASAKTIQFKAAAPTPQPKATNPFTQTPRTEPSGTNNVRLLSTTVVSYSGKNEIVDEARKALASVKAVDPQSISYDASTTELSMRVSGNSIATRPITDALLLAGIKTQGVRVGPVPK
jgi:hypothetical protein